jgi:hypothetical protein
MIISEVVTLCIYAFSMIFLTEYFGAFRLHISDSLRVLTRSQPTSFLMVF